MSLSLPPSRQWKQTNGGEVFGSLFATRNMNFDEDGYLKLARKSVAFLYNSSNLGSICSIDYIAVNGFNQGYYMMTSNQPFYFNGSSTSPTSLSGSGHGGGATFDGLVWQSRWYISQSGSFSYTADGSTWTTSLGSLSSNPHPLCVFENLNNLAVGDGNTVKLYDTSHTLVKTLTLPSVYEVRWMVWKNNNLFIGTRNTAGGKAMLFLWDGSTTAAQSGYQVDGAWIFSGCAYKSTVAVIASNGQLLQFNGGGFDVLANLPVYNTSYAWYDGNGFTNGRVNWRGMIADGEVIYLNIDGTISGNSGYIPNQPSGLWQYDPKVGLYHKAGWGNSKVIQMGVFSVTVDYTVDTFTYGSSINAPTGTLIRYLNGDVGGIKQNTDYYLINLGSGSFKLANTYGNALNGTAIDITSNGSFSSFVLTENDHYGNVNGSAQQGAVALISDLDFNYGSYGQVNDSTLFFGNRLNDIATGGTVTVLNSLARGFNIGSFVTQKIYASNTTDIFSKIITKFDRLYEQADKITLKFRSKKREGFPIYGNFSYPAIWVDSTHFTTAADLTNVIAGDEVEFLDGRASGYNVHITTKPTYSSGVWTVTIDEALPYVAASDQSLFAIDNWTKITAITPPQIKNFAAANLQGDSTWIQIKGEVRGISEPVIEEVLVINSPFKQNA